MFWNSKKESTEQEGVLRDLTEGQLSMVAGGVANDHDADDMKWNKKHHHHHHHHHHKKKTWTNTNTWTNDHDADDKTTTTSWANTSWSSGGTQYGQGHW